MAMFAARNSSSRAVTFPQELRKTTDVPNVWNTCTRAIRSRHNTVRRACRGDRDAFPTLRRVACKRRTRWFFVRRPVFTRRLREHVGDGRRVSRGQHHVLRAAAQVQRVPPDAGGGRVLGHRLVPERGVRRVLSGPDRLGRVAHGPPVHQGKSEIHPSLAPLSSLPPRAHGLPNGFSIRPRKNKPRDDTRSMFTSRKPVCRIRFVKIRPRRCLSTTPFGSIRTYSRLSVTRSSLKTYSQHSELTKNVEI